MPFSNRDNAMATIRQALVLFVPTALAIGLVAAFLFERSISEDLSKLKLEQKQELEIAEHRKNAELSSVISDIRYLVRATATRRFLKTKSTSFRRDLAADYLNFVTTKKIYDQVRFIGMDGKEIARADWNNGRPAITPDARLQNKSNRYYFRETVKLAAGGTYISPFDLNVENGVVQSPQKPMIRIGMPVFDGQGRKRGVVILNYLGERLLNSLEQVDRSMSGDFWLLNAEGYWLLGPQADEFSFMYPARKGQTFGRTHPEAWSRIRHGSPVDQFMADGQLFTYSRVSSFPESGDAGAIFPTWYLVSRVPKAVLGTMRSELAYNYVAVTAVMLVLLTAACAISSIHRRARILAEDRVHESELRLRSYLDSSPDAVIVADTDGRIEFANPAVEEIFGHSAKDLLGQPVELLVPVQFHNQHLTDRANYIGNPEARAVGLNRRVSGVRADGTEVPVGIRLGYAEIDGRGVVIATATDITAIKERDDEIAELTASLTRQNIALTSANKELEAFSYSVSHDLRAPLRSMDGFSQVLLEDYGDQLDDQGRDYLGRVRKAAQNMGSLIDDMLTLSRITRDELSRESFDLSTLAREIAERNVGEAPDRKIEFDVTDGLTMEGDRQMVRIALENLMGNAVKFTAPRTPARIEIGQERVGEETPFYVRDNGVGFDMAYAEKLFVAFQRLHDARVFPGTGIGLAIVQRVIGKHGGRIWAEAEPDKGATFYFTL